LAQVPVISIIDDDASVRVATNRLVRSLGYVAHTFASAEEFLASSRVNDTSCMIADVQMPGMSGIELQSHLLAQGRRLPIIFITAFPEESARTKALNAGAVCFLSKPFDGQTLVRHLDAVVKPHRGGPARFKSN
jgi:FixJ family two-component response regulator